MKSLFKADLVLGGFLLLYFQGATPGMIDYSTDKNTQQEVLMTSKEDIEKNKAIVRKIYEKILNTGKLELLDEVISPEFTAATGEKGAAAFGAIIKALRQGFPDIQWKVEDLIGEHDKVVIRTTWKGMHTGQFRTFSATGKKVNDSAIVIYQLKDGKIIDAKIETDRLGFLQQLGLIPTDVSTLKPVK